MATVYRCTRGGYDPGRKCPGEPDISDSLISHGASEVLTERLCTSSDAYKAVFCKTCGNIAISSAQTQAQTCRCCGNAGKFGTCQIPYAFRLLQNLLAGAALSIRFKLREKEEE